MDFMQAIDRRISCRAYTGDAVEEQKVQQLRDEIEAINAETGLHFQLYGPREDGSAIDVQKRMFSGKVPLYAALVGKQDPLSMETLGYYGERLVLLATTLGLGTCWIASTYDKDTVRADLGEGEVLQDVIAIGYAPDKMPFMQTTIRSAIRKRDKKLSDLFKGAVSFEEAPEWIRAGVEAARKAPTAANEQTYVFTQAEKDGPVRATLPAFKHDIEYTDLGIVKLHFELAAKSCGVEGTWQWGEGAEFRLA